MMRKETKILIHPWILNNSKNMKVIQMLIYWIKLVILILYFKKVKLSFDIFNIKQRAKEFGMKLKIFSEEGEVIVNSSFDRIKILVNV